MQTDSGMPRQGRIILPNTPHHIRQHDPVIDFDICYEALGDDAASRQAAYQQYAVQTIPDEEFELIRGAKGHQLTGTGAIRRKIKQKFGIKISDNGRGRPKKLKNKSVPFLFKGYFFILR